MGSTFVHFFMKQIFKSYRILFVGALTLNRTCWFNVVKISLLADSQFHTTSEITFEHVINVALNNIITSFPKFEKRFIKWYPFFYTKPQSRPNNFKLNNVPKILEILQVQYSKWEENYTDSTLINYLFF